MRKFQKLISAATATLLFASAALAQDADFPSKPVTVIVPFSAGGVTDIIARVLADELSQSLGQPFVVENKPGAGSAIGVEQLVRSNPDGYTLAMIAANVATMEALYPTIAFEPTEDITPVANVTTAAIGIAVHESIPVSSLPELTEYIRANPDISFTSCGNASPQHIAGEYYKSLTGLEMTHVNYKGCGASIPDVLAGRVPLVFASIPHLIPHRGGTLKLLAIASPERSDLIPDVPTTVEMGYEDYTIDAWFGIVAPKGTPEAIVAKLNTAINDALRSSSMQDRMTLQNLIPTGGTAEEFDERIQRDKSVLGALVEKAGITAN